ncbi:MAG: HAMP domain-containing histidine kinase [Flavobacteriales bacterium]|nr:HAMP domain-containing histidine kinase [Flavobacteriales bacterium]
MNLESTINQIYQHGVQIKLRHDMVCRKIANEIMADSVSILLYRGPTNNLECTGRYINPRPDKANVDFTNCNLEHLPQIMSHIDVWEYVKTIENKPITPNYADYQTSHFFDNNISQKEFHDIVSTTTVAKWKNQYWRYKSCFDAEHHPVGTSNSLSGKYYFLLHNRLFKKENFDIGVIHDATSICVKSLRDSSELTSECRKNLTQKLRISLAEGGVYVGIPLVSDSKRIIGILRITFRKQIFPEIFKSDNSNQENHLAELLESKYEITNIASLIGDRLSNHELLTGFRRISFKRQLNQEFADYNKLADELTSVVNCFGCIVRTQASSGKIKITGHSISVKEYVEIVNSRNDPFADKLGLAAPLVKLFDDSDTDAPKEIGPVIGAKIKLSPNLKPRLRYYVLDGGDQIIEVTKTSFVPQSSISEIEQQLQELAKYSQSLFESFDIKEVLLMPIKELKGSMITLLNKSTHPFDLRDIELIYIVVQRIGLEFAHLQENLKEKKRGKEEALIDGTRILFHQLGAPISSLNQHIVNISQGLITDKEKVRLRLEEMEFTYDDFLDMLKTNQFFSDLSAKGQISVRANRFNISQFIVEKIRPYQLRARKEKDLSIAYIESSESTEAGLYSDKTLLGHVVQCLIDNAIKYSFPKADRERDWYVSRREKYGIEPVIALTAVNTSSKFVLTVSNWGCRIKKNELRNIFELNTQGDDARNFEGVVGSGIGLYVVDRIMRALGGKAEATHDETSGKTSIIVQIDK